MTGIPVRVQVVGDSWYGRGGQSPYEGWLRDQCSTIDTPVDFIPFVDRVAVAKILASSSAACFPSTTETLPTAVLEAMASALPVVCSDIPGMLEAGGGAVIACPADDIEALAAALASLAEDARVWADRSRAVWERSALFSWDEASRAIARFPSWRGFRSSAVPKPARCPSQRGPRASAVPEQARHRADPVGTTSS